MALAVVLLLTVVTPVVRTLPLVALVVVRLPLMAAAVVVELHRKDMVALAVQLPTVSSLLLLVRAVVVVPRTMPVAPAKAAWLRFSGWRDAVLSD